HGHYPDSRSGSKGIEAEGVEIGVYGGRQFLFVGSERGDFVAVYRLDDEQRAVAHLAAVFVNNFSNHLFAIGKEILAAKNLPFDLLLPLIRETVAKLETSEPETMQTGPAIRGDEATIQRHLELLKSNATFREVYRMLTCSIQAFAD
ncbi:MAG: DUF2520 domain-containing protein, partial [Bacteroidota bacterium]